MPHHSPDTHLNSRLKRRQFLEYSSIALSSSLLLKACAPASPPKSPQPIKVAAVYTTPIEQQWVNCVHRAIAQTQAEQNPNFLIKYVWSEAVAVEQYSQVLRDYAAAGQDLIIGESFANEAECRAIAQAYPQVAFLMGSNGTPSGDNYAIFHSAIHEATYLAGMLAGGMTRSKIIGLIGSYPLPETNRLLQAFIAGARTTQPRVKFRVAFLQSWFAPSQAQALAIAQIKAKADILFAEPFGVIDTAQAHNILAIATLTDQQLTYPHTILTTALWNFKPTLDRALTALRTQQFQAEDYSIYSTLRYGGSSLAPLGSFSAKVPQSLQTQINQRQAEILSGTFTVGINEAEPRTDTNLKPRRDR